MPPSQPNPLDPDRIDISLDLVGAGSIEAVQQLTQQLQVVTQFMANAQTGSPESAAAGARAAANAFAPRVGNIQHGPHAYQSHGGNSPVVIDGAGERASMGFVDRTLERYRATEHDQLVRRARLGMSANADQYDSLYSGRTGGAEEELRLRSGTPSTGASLPADGASTNDPLWRQALMSNPVEWERSQEGIRLPPGGLSLNIQDKLRIASDYLAQQAERRYTSGQAAAIPEAQAQATALGFTPEQIAQMPTGGVTEAGQTMGNVAGLLRIGSEHAAQAQLVVGDLRNYAQRANAYAGAYQQAGVQAGYERAGQINIPGTNIGITNPLDFFRGNSAAREGLNQRINIQRLRLMGGIDQNQAREIVGGLAGSGWTGEQGQNIAFDAIAPLVQQGMNPGLATQSFDQMARQGNASLSDIVDTLSNLGDSARTANMSLDEYQQGLMEFADQAKQYGAIGTQGAQLGRNLTDSLGVAPQVAAQFFQNPLVQGQYMAQTGMLPNTMGMAGGHQVNQAVYGAIDMAMQATRGFAVNGQASVDPITGHRISGRAYQEQEAAQILGMSRNELVRLNRERTTAPARSAALELLNRYNPNAPGAAGRPTSTPGSTVPLGQGGGVHGGTASIVDAQNAINAAHGITPTTPTTDAGWEKIHRQLMLAAPSTPGSKDRNDYIAKVRHIETESGQQRIKDTRQLIRDQSKIATPDNTPTVYVKFKGPAAKFFEQDKKGDAKRNANAGGVNLAQNIIQNPKEAQNLMGDYFDQQGISNGG